MLIDLRYSVPAMATMLAVSSSSGQIRGADDVAAIVPFADLNVPEANDEAFGELDQWFGRMPGRIVTEHDARRFLELLWHDFGDPGTNGQAQLAALFLSKMLINDDTSTKARETIRRGLLDYLQYGGLENLPRLSTFASAGLASTLAALVTAEDVEGQQALLELAAVIAGTPEEYRLTPGAVQEGTLRGAGGDARLAAMAVQFYASRNESLLQRYREIFGDQLTEDTYAMLAKVLVGDLQATADHFVTLAAERELGDDKAADSREHQLAGAKMPTLEALKKELRLLLRERGDAARVHRVARYAAAITATRVAGDKAYHLVLATYRRLLMLRRRPVHPAVTTAIEEELVRLEPKKLDTTAREWARTVLALGRRAGSQLRDELRRRVRKTETKRLRSMYRQLLSQLPPADTDSDNGSSRDKQSKDSP